MLDRQYHLYSCDTGHFYSNREKYLHDMHCRYRSEHKAVNARLSELEKQLKALGCSDQDIRTLGKDNMTATSIPETAHGIAAQYRKWAELAQHKNAKIKESKEKLLALLSGKTARNEATGGKDHIRAVRADSLKDTDVISVFDSFLSRTIGIQPDELTDTLMIVQVYYFDIFKDISFYGFLYQGKKYRYLTSSAGQIRTKKAVFIKESVWSRIEKTIMCGLTIDRINSRGGSNVNKFLAYLALANSATDAWEEFPIEHSIVIEDFETNVYGTFDFVDETDYSITRKTGYVPVPHTDGAGMILPSVCTKNFMFRAPWIKGLLGVFDFRRFIEVHHCSPLITDIYGREHDIIKEDIRIIFTKSQFKMYRFYNSWEEYREYFRKYHCSAGRCNIEEDRIKTAKINYQMLQTLTDITDEEIDLLTRKSSERISNICSSQETMLDILGATPYNTNMSPFQEAVKLYPALLGDTYTKDILREVKNSLLKKYRSGKLEVTGKYAFLLPDYYAACEYWFGHIETPKGLLADQEVFCRLFRQSGKLDCLRSPHLYKEHAIRRNIAHPEYGERTQQIGEWFTTDGIYASTHDLISKLLMYDVDGDKALVVADADLIRIAERNMEGIVPLYYNMKKADPAQLTSQTIYAGLHAAFTHGNIGVYSNNLAKIWNSDIFVSGTEEERQEAADMVKLLCMENNFCIDSAKTLYMPKRPEWFSPMVSRFTNQKLPAFFEYAKDKDRSQLQARNQSFVNRIFDKIPDRPINTRSLQLEKIDYRNLMADERMVCPKEVSQRYDTLNRQYRYQIHMKEERTDNLRYVACSIRREFGSLGYSEETISDMLVEYLYGRNKRYKQLLWFCYGNYLVNHLKKKLGTVPTKWIRCMDCGEWVEVSIKDHKTCRCMICQQEETKRRKREYWHKRKG